jgi:hypothetical protein
MWALFRFYAELNDHLPAGDKYNTLHKTIDAPSVVKDLIEGFGVPGAEIDLIVANGESVDFSYMVRDRDRIALYPMFESFDIAPVLRVRQRPLRCPRFVVDGQLVGLAGALIDLGFDVLNPSGLSDLDLTGVSAVEHRILLTRDWRILERGHVTHGYWVRETDCPLQIAEVVGRFDLARALHGSTGGSLRVAAETSGTDPQTGGLETYFTGGAEERR